MSLRKYWDRCLQTANEALHYAYIFICPPHGCSHHRLDPLEWVHAKLTIALHSSIHEKENHEESMEHLFVHLCVCVLERE